MSRRRSDKERLWWSRTHWSTGSDKCLSKACALYPVMLLQAQWLCEGYTSQSHASRKARRMVGAWFVVFPAPSSMDGVKPRTEGANVSLAAQEAVRKSGRQQNKSKLMKL